MRRTVGSAAAMRQQLARLIDVGQRSNVSLQVLPFDARTYTAASFGFIMLRFGHDAASDVIYVETYTDADYLDRPDAVKAYTRLWDRLRAAALGPVESLSLIEQVAVTFGSRP